MRVWRVLVLVGVLAGALAADESVQSPPLLSASAESPMAHLANPAAVYCTDLGYEFATVDRPDGQDGTCLLPDGESCEAWEFLKGRCGQEYSYCAQHGWRVETRTDGADPFTPEYGVCVSASGAVVGSVTDLTDLSERAEHGGCGSSSETPIAVSSDAQAAPTLSRPGLGGVAPDPPASFDWRSNGGDWLTPIKDQGGCGSCWAFAAIGAVEAGHNISAGNPNLDLDLSEQYLVSDCFGGGSCCGGFKDQALRFITESGIPDEVCLPYVDGASGGCSCDDDTCDTNCTYRSGGACSDRTCGSRCTDWASRLTRIEGWGRSGTDPATIKQRLVDTGPLAASIGISSKYGGYFDGDIYRCSNDSGSNHAVVIVGYDDVGQYWIIRNSWGTSWGSGGYFKMGYGECSVERHVYWAVADAPPVISINSVSGSEASGQLLFTVSLDKASRQVVTVDRGTLNGTAVDPYDYFAPSSHPITFHPGETSKTIPITLEDDTIDEADETFRFTLSHPVNVVLGVAEGVGTILDNDPDTTAPMVTVPGNMTVEATGPLGRVVSFAASAIDPPHSSPPVACRPSSGSVFPLGRTTVVCSATDASGNTGTNTFTVSVRDTTAPVVIASPDMTVQAVGAAGATVSYPAARATDVVGVTVGPTCAPASGSLFPVGATTVTCTASDAAGNVGSGTFRITVSPLLEMSFRSIGQYDGWVLESAETSVVGGTLDATATTCRVGDDAADRQYRSILDFNTGSLPNDAVITGVALRVKSSSVAGASPFGTHGLLTADIRRGNFNGNVALETADFQAAASKTSAGTFATVPVSGWYRSDLVASAYSKVNPKGHTQVRLRFATDDNNDNGADYLAFFCGNAAAASRPQLIVTYYVP